MYTLAAMYDKADLRIPFHSDHVQEISEGRDGQPRGFVPIEKYDFPAESTVAFVDGQRVYTDLRARKWGTVSSSISTLAVGFFPEGNGFYPWPHVSIKASPSKILQGHNVFGTENIRPGILQMLANLEQGFPKISAHLDVANAEIRYIDSTYSALVESEYKRNQIIKLIESIFPNKDDITRYTGYLQANKHSDYHRQKVYYKGQELQADTEQAQLKGQGERVRILKDQRLIDFANGRLRFEATTGHRAFERLGIPTLLPEFLKFHDWFERVHKFPLSRHLWDVAFKKTFAQVEGHTMKNVDDDHIKLKIDARYIRIKDNGKICKRKANAIFRTFRDIKSEGYDQLAKERNSTFFFNVKALESIGLSRAFLKSLDPKKPNANVVPLVQLIKVDFSKQRPDWYTEPTEGYNDQRRHIKAVS